MKKLISIVFIISFIIIVLLTNCTNTNANFVKETINEKRFIKEGCKIETMYQDNRINEILIFTDDEGNKFIICRIPNSISIEQIN